MLIINKSFIQKTRHGLLYPETKKLLFPLLSAAFDNVGKQFVFISCVVVEQTVVLERMQGCCQKVLLPSGSCSVHLRLWLLLFARWKNMKCFASTHQRSSPLSQTSLVFLFFFSWPSYCISKSFASVCGVPLTAAHLPLQDSDCDQSTNARIGKLDAGRTQVRFFQLTP